MKCEYSKFIDMVINMSTEENNSTGWTTGVPQDQPISDYTAL